MKKLPKRSVPNGNKNKKENEMSSEPLAFRMRPKTLEDYVGQEHVIGKDKYIEINKHSSDWKPTQIEMNESDEKIKEIQVPYII